MVTGALPLTWAWLVPLVTGDGSGPMGTAMLVAALTLPCAPKAIAYLLHAPLWE